MIFFFKYLMELEYKDSSSSIDICFTFSHIMNMYTKIAQRFKKKKKKKSHKILLINIIISSNIRDNILNSLLMLFVLFKIFKKNVIKIQHKNENEKSPQYTCYNTSFGPDTITCYCHI